MNGMVQDFAANMLGEYARINGTKNVEGKELPSGGESSISEMYVYTTTFRDGNQCRIKCNRPAKQVINFMAALKSVDCGTLR
jgi:outer membrane lipoprotein-sorting protein